MANSSESTPFLASNDRPDDTNARNDSEDANAHFKRPIKILTICVSIASVLGAIFLTASFITVQAAPFAPFPMYTYSARFLLQELGTCVFVSFILSTLMIFIQPPITVNLLINLILTILILVFAGNIFGQGWPDNSWCYDFRNPDHLDTQCIQWRVFARILMGIGGGLGLLVGLFYLVLLLLRVVAISRTKFWKRNGMCLSHPSGQYTFQITLGFPNKCPGNNDGENGNAREESRSDGVEGRLIDA